MPTIRPLSEEIIAKIAAGEVIERPVYAVKELIENAIDAKATSIAISVEESGLRKISVIDNGEGMSTEDIQECFKPHTTSKLSSLDHLNHIETLGFRGEALSSIAAISTVSIKSKTREQTAGTHIVLRKGQIEKISPIGMPHGTTIIVENLFATVPARKNFLKSGRTEFRHIVDCVTYAALSYPHIHFALHHNSRRIFNLPKTYHILERMRSLLGNTIYEALIPIHAEDSYVAISGFLTRPHVATSLQKQFLFINNRKVTDKLISQAVKDAYATLLEAKSHPVYLLSLALPYEFVDVNVHPRKEEIRFANNQLLYDAVFTAVKEALNKHNLSRKLNERDAFGRSGNTHSFAARLLREKALPWQLQNETGFSGQEIIQIHNLYLVSQTKAGILIFDQHAVHERILYEQFLEEFLKQRKQTKSYFLPTPVIVALSFSQTEILLEHLSYLRKLGFQMKQQKNNMFSLLAVPELLRDRDAEQLLVEMMEGLEKEKHPDDIDSVSKRMLAYLACRKAVKAGDKLTAEQRRELIDQLKKTNNNATCPHGRPTKIVINLEKLHKLFKR